MPQLDNIDQPSPTVLDGRVTGGRKGIPFDWQALEAAAGVARIEADLRRAPAVAAV